MNPTAVPSIEGAARIEDASDGTKRKAGTFAVRLRRLASEPFVHFTLLGALVFAGHRLVARASDVPTLEVSTSKQRELAKLFEQRQQRPPNDVERQQLIQRYVEDEVLFREGVRLSLVNTDPMLHAHLVARVRSLLQAEIEEKPATGGDGREQVGVDERRDRVARAFRAEVDRLKARYRVHVAEQP
jgi:hypothetical protein